MTNKIIAVVEIGFPKCIIIRQNNDSSELITLADLIKELQYQLEEEVNSLKMGWKSGKVTCDLCNHTWIAVFNMLSERLECPNCGNMAMYEYKPLENE